VQLTWTSFSPDGISVVLGGVAVIGAATCLGSVVLLHFLPTGYNPIRNAVSDYGVGPYRIWHRIAVVALAVAGLAMTLASSGSIRKEPPIVIGFLLSFSVTRILIPFFPTDIEGQPRTRTGSVHLGLALVAFASLASAAGFFEGTNLDNLVGWVVVATAVFSLVALPWPRLKPIFGLLERLFYLSMIGWLLVIGIELILLAIRY